ncbi:MAG: nuclear transport factor 2 family protein [Steroidobacteraceae bacterium]
MSESNRALVVAYYKKLYSRDCAAAMDESLADNYVEHQYTTGFTETGLRAYVMQRLEQHPQHRVIVHHVLSDGDFVFLFVEEKLSNGVDYARAELFRLENGKIAEHWGSHVLDEKNRKNSNGTFDGPQVNRNVDYGRRFAARLEELDARGFDGQELHTFEESRVPEYRQHSPKGGDGMTGLVEILSKAKQAGIKVSMSRKRTLSDGDFVMSHRLYNTDPPHPLMNRINTFDMFRLNADGRAVEHWDVMEDVPSADLLTRMF